MTPIGVSLGVKGLTLPSRAAIHMNYITRVFADIITLTRVRETADSDYWLHV